MYSCLLCTRTANNLYNELADIHDGCNNNHAGVFVELHCTYWDTVKFVNISRRAEEGGNRGGGNSRLREILKRGKTCTLQVGIKCDDGMPGK